MKCPALPLPSDLPAWICQPTPTLSYLCPTLSNYKIMFCGLYSRSFANEADITERSIAARPQQFLRIKSVKHAKFSCHSQEYSLGF